MSRGQILERMTVIAGGPSDPGDPASAPVDLEALWQPGVEGALGVARGQGAMPVVLAGPHPRLGGNMDAPACAEIVWHLARRAHPTLRFNWRGVGASTGTTRIPWLALDAAPLGPGAIDDEVGDLARAVEHHAAGAPCAIVGVSFGCAPAAAVAATHPLVERVVLVAPPLGLLPFDLDALAAAGVPVSAVLGAADTTAPPEEIVAALGGRFRVDVVPNATHAFTAGLVELGRRVAAALPGGG